MEILMQGVTESLGAGRFAAPLLARMVVPQELPRHIQRAHTCGIYERIAHARDEAHC